MRKTNATGVAAAIIGLAVRRRPPCRSLAIQRCDYLVAPSARGTAHREMVCSSRSRCGAMDTMTTAIWPLFGLNVSTPRLSLRYVTDELGEQLAELAARGIHDPNTMPFSEPWTDVGPPELQRNTMRYFWCSRAETTSEHWHLNLATHDQDGVLIGLCSLDAEGFTTHRTATTGSWIGRQFQGRGLGREMRQAALHLLFAGLSGERATTRAWHDNIASLRVTRSLPYTQDDAVQEQRRERLDTMLAFSMTRRQWQTVRRNDIGLTGVEPTREFLHATTATEG
jgi:RimJ/RimL family protein N-acetyltransferase